MLTPPNIVHTYCVAYFVPTGPIRGLLHADGSLPFLRLCPSVTPACHVSRHQHITPGPLPQLTRGDLPSAHRTQAACLKLGAFGAPCVHVLLLSWRWCLNSTTSRPAPPVLVYGHRYWAPRPLTCLTVTTYAYRTGHRTKHTPHKAKSPSRRALACCIHCSLHTCVGKGHQEYRCANHKSCACLCRNH